MQDVRQMMIAVYIGCFLTDHGKWRACLDLRHGQEKKFLDVLGHEIHMLVHCQISLGKMIPFD